MLSLHRHFKYRWYLDTYFGNINIDKVMINLFGNIDINKNIDKAILKIMILISISICLFFKISITIEDFGKYQYQYCLWDFKKYQYWYCVQIFHFPCSKRLLAKHIPLKSWSIYVFSTELCLRLQRRHPLLKSSFQFLSNYAPASTSLWYWQYRLGVCNYGV